MGEGIPIDEIPAYLEWNPSLNLGEETWNFNFCSYLEKNMGEKKSNLEVLGAGWED